MPCWKADWSMLAGTREEALPADTPDVGCWSTNRNHASPFRLCGSAGRTSTSGSTPCELKKLRGHSKEFKCPLRRAERPSEKVWREWRAIRVAKRFPTTHSRAAPHHGTERRSPPTHTASASSPCHASRKDGSMTGYGGGLGASDCCWNWSGLAD